MTEAELRAAGKVRTILPKVWCCKKTHKCLDIPDRLDQWSVKNRGGNYITFAKQGRETAFRIRFKLEMTTVGEKRM